MAEDVNNSVVPGIQRYATQIEEDQEARLEEKVQKCVELYRNSRWNIWMDFAETTTLHGPIHITCTKRFLRAYYVIVVAFMSSFFIAHAAYLFIQYLSFPILTEIKYGNIDFTYPDITLCPNSPFTDAAIADNTDLARTLNTSEAFWREANQIKFGSPRWHHKRSMLSVFHKSAEKLGKRPSQHVLECQVNKQECLDNFIITEHPLYYRCFTLRVHPRPPVPAGPTNGIRLILHRGRPNAYPLLLVAEEEPSILQSVDSPEAALAKDGFFLAFHEKGTFPTFPVQSLPNGLSLRFGQSMRVGLEEIHYEAVNLSTRACADGDYAPQIELLRLDKQSESNALPGEADQKMVKFKYTRQNCVAIMRQRLTYERCRCFSEAYAIPYSMRDIGQVWCHDLATSTSKIIHFGDTLDCIRKIEMMTDDEVLAETKPVSPGDGLNGCPLRCKRRMINVHSSLQTKLVQSLNPQTLIPYYEMLHLKQLTGPDDAFVNQTGAPLDPQDLIFLDIHPVSEMVNQIIENPGYTITKFLADLGGISGLYVGITMYTVAEIIDLITQFLFIYIPYLWSVTTLQMTRKRNLAAQVERHMAEETMKEEKGEEDK
ncbi:unnamed protein product [Calicophoron daubneyi]|uniref:Uncharacterized protein n=1 Tax=Calicophoron daubneyi TaxID=300641 RepID=A0AAV2T7L8_CALDB